MQVLTVVTLAHQLSFAKMCVSVDQFEANFAVEGNERYTACVGIFSPSQLFLVQPHSCHTAGATALDA